MQGKAAHNLLKCNNLMHNGLTWGHCMNQQPWSKPLVIVELPAEPHTYDELETVTQVAVNRPDSDIIIDFSRIENLDRRSMLSLVVLHRLLEKSMRHLGFCHIQPALKATLQQHGLAKVIEKRPDQDIVLEPWADASLGGVLILANQGECYEKRHYQRLSLSKWLKISVQLWHVDEDSPDTQLPPARYWEGTLADVGAGGAQVVIDVRAEPDFAKGESLRLRFAPISYDTPATYEAEVRELLSTADEQNICLGLQFQGLESNPDGHLKLIRLCTSGLRYFETAAQDTNASTQAE